MKTFEYNKLLKSLKLDGLDVISENLVNLTKSNLRHDFAIGNYSTVFILNIDENIDEKIKDTEKKIEKLFSEMKYTDKEKLFENIKTKEKDLERYCIDLKELKRVKKIFNPEVLVINQYNMSLNYHKYDILSHLMYAVLDNKKLISTNGYKRISKSYIKFINNKNIENFISFFNILMVSTKLNYVVEGIFKNQDELVRYKIKEKLSKIKSEIKKLKKIQNDMNNKLCYDINYRNSVVQFNITPKIERELKLKNILNKK